MSTNDAGQRFGESMQTPDGESVNLTRDEFFEVMLDARMPDVMDFHLFRTVDEPGRSFSAEAIETVGYQMHDYVTASVLRRWNQTGKPPTNAKVTVQIEWGGAMPPENLRGRTDVNPWYSLDDVAIVDATPLTPDGDVRFRAFLDRP